MSEKAEEMFKNTYGDLIDSLDYDYINKKIDFTNHKDLPQISKKTILNIGKWALNGADNQEIARNLELSERQFTVLCNLCPTIMYLMSKSRQLADIVIAGTLVQKAIGGQKIHKRVAIKIGDYEDGKKIGEHVEYVEQEEELPPDSYLLKFLAENKLSEKFGKSKVDDDKEIRNVVDSLTPEQLESISKSL